MPWNKIGRFVTPAIILFFFLPFFGISCNGMSIVHVTGADLVGGCRPGGMLVDMADKLENQPSVVGDDPAGDDARKEPASKDAGKDDLRAAREPLAIAAMSIAVVLVLLSWMRSRTAAIAALVLALGGLGTLIALRTEVKGDSGDRVEKQAGAGAGGEGADAGEVADQLDDKIDVKFETRSGFWLSCLGFAGAAGLAGASLGRRGRG
jgi:hypothetical protein